VRRVHWRRRQHIDLHVNKHRYAALVVPNVAGCPALQASQRSSYEENLYDTLLQ
jgi:hypothetical protein